LPRARAIADSVEHDVAACSERCDDEVDKAQAEAFYKFKSRRTSALEGEGG
jgi:hypothetical protein